MRELYKYVLLCGIMLGFFHCVLAQETEEIPHEDDNVLKSSFLTIRDIIITGNKITKAYIIAREIPMKKNNRYSISDILKNLPRSKQNLINTGLFIDVTVDFSNWFNDSMDIVVDVKERWYYFPVPIEEVVWTMNHLIQQGKILYWGTSQWSGPEIMEAHRVAGQYKLIGPAMEQPQYNMFERFKMEQDYLPVFQNVGLGTTIWSPLAAGFLTGKYNDGIPAGSRLSIEGFDWLKERWIQDDKIKKVKKLGDLAGKMGVSLPSLAIAWTIRNPNVTTAILGATKKQQLEENLKALEVVKKLTPEIIEKIEKILQNKPKLDLA